MTKRHQRSPPTRWNHVLPHTLYQAARYYNKIPSTNSSLGRETSWHTARSRTTDMACRPGDIPHKMNFKNMKINATDTDIDHHRITVHSTTHGEQYEQTKTATQAMQILYVHALQCIFCCVARFFLQTCFIRGFASYPSCALGDLALISTICVNKTRPQTNNA